MGLTEKFGENAGQWVTESNQNNTDPISHNAMCI